jgi:riboflavin synthase
VFTGLVEACVAVRSFERLGSGARLVLPAPDASWQVVHGESVCVSGACLTVAGLLPSAAAPPDMSFDLTAETLERTWFSALAPGRAVHLERAMRLSDRLGGHLVNGHVDAVGVIDALRDSGDGGRTLGVSVPAGFERWLIDKGSVAVDGVSLTVVAPRDRRFEVALVPATLAKTQLGSALVGQRVNLEADPIGKWVERFVSASSSAR